MSWIDVTYHVRASAADIESAAAALALEQSVEVPADVVHDPWVREHVMGRVASIEPLDADRFRVGIRLATLTTGHDAAQAINMLFGNSSLHEHVELVDAAFPPASSRDSPARATASTASVASPACTAGRSPVRR